MEVLYELLSNMCSMTLLFFAFLLLEAINFFLPIIGIAKKSGQSIVTTAEYLKLVEEENPAIFYTEALWEQKGSTGCTVCLTEFSEGDWLRKLGCGHTFHKDCLDKWLQRFLATCPLCRTKVLPEEIVAGNRRKNQILDDEMDEETTYMLAACMLW
uniref:RING-type domain-containing protein n=1 Tax=Rhizophora mucronata TaxID=61149 RepID=A0A2P2IYQ3_RHIMU